jgi:hypothetical protein
MTTLKALDLLATPSLRQLSFALRNQETWPEGFTWDYDHCAKCAMGLAINMGMTSAQSIEEDNWLYSHTAVQDAFSLPERIVVSIFRDASHHYDVTREEVTPEMVADLIDVYLGDKK